MATEHSVMTALGAAGGARKLSGSLDRNPTGIVSCVGDSYNIYKFAEALGSHFKYQILAREGKFVLRPDSVTPEDPTPESCDLAAQHPWPRLRNDGELERASRFSTRRSGCFGVMESTRPVSRRSSRT